MHVRSTTPHRRDRTPPYKFDLEQFSANRRILNQSTTLGVTRHGNQIPTFMYDRSSTFELALDQASATGHVLDFAPAFRHVHSPGSVLDGSPDPRRDG